MIRTTTLSMALIFASTVAAPAAPVLPGGGTLSGFLAILGEDTLAYDDDATIAPAGVTFAVGAVEYLVVGGGGGGGTNRGHSDSGAGGGGAGGFVEGILGIAEAEYEVIVGAGGAGGPGTGNAPGVNGDNSSLGDIVGLGGGGGSGGNDPAVAGGSGGGARARPGAAALQPDSPSGGFGNPGGGRTSDPGGGRAAGGGGGAGTAGAIAADAYHGGPGGDGLPSTITGEEVYYAGGGGSGTGADRTPVGPGGIGGGGDGGNNNITPGVGTPNTGGGGGGGNNSVNGAAGGSGVVYIRYAGNGAVASGGAISSLTGAHEGYTLHAFDDPEQSYQFALNPGVSLSQEAIFSGVLSGTGGLTAAGPGALVLAGANTYSGDTRVTGGVLRLAHGLALQNSALAEGSVEFDQAGGNAFTFGGLAGSGNLELQNNAPSPAAVALTIGGNNQSTAYSGNLSGPGSLTKTGTGTLALSGVNTYEGLTTVEQGALAVASTGALPGWDQPGAYSVNSGAALTVGNAVSDADIGTMLGTGNFEAGARFGFDTAAGDRTYGHAIADTNEGALGVLKTGPGTLTLTGPNTYTGGTTISGGTLQLDDDSGTDALGTGDLVNNATLAINRSDVLAFDRTMSGSGVLTKLGTGTVILSVENTHTGGTTISEGTLRLEHTAGAGSGTIQIGDGTLSLFRDGATTTYANSIASQSGTSGTLTLDGSGSNAGNGVNTTYATGPITVDGTLTISRPTGGSGATRFTGVLAGSGTLIVANTNGGEALSEDSRGRLQFDNASNTFNGSVQVLAGGNFLNHTMNPTYQSLDVAAGGYVTIVADGSTRTTTVGALDGAGHIIRNTQSGTARLQVGSGNFSGTIDDGAFGGGPGSIELVKTGAGTLVLSGANTYRGATTISAGTLRVTNTAGLGSGQVVMNGGTLELLHNGPGSGETITYNTNDKVTNSGNTFTIHVGNNGANTDNTIVWPGTYNLGNSTLNVTGANGYRLELPEFRAGGGGAGTAIVNPTSANLILGNVSNWNTGHTLQLGGTSAGNRITGTMSNGAGTLAVDKTGTGTWTFTGNNTYTGTTTLRQGTLAVASTSNVGTGLLDFRGNLGIITFRSADASTLTISNPLNLATDVILGSAGTGNLVFNGTMAAGGGPKTLTINNATTTFNGVISGTSDPLTKDGPGTLVFAAANTYSKPTIVNAGALRLAHSHALQNSTLATGGVEFDQSVSGNAFTLGGLAGGGNIALRNNAATPAPVALSVGNNNADTLFGGVLSGPGSLVKTGSGTLTLYNANTYAGATTIEAGTLRLGTPGAGNPVGYWAMSEGPNHTAFANAVAGGPDGTLHNNPAWIEGPGGEGTWGVQFNGSNQWGSISPDATLDAVGDGAHSISAWVKTGNTGSWYNSAVSKFDSNSTTPFWGIGWRGANNLGFVVRTGSGNETAAGTGADALDNEWHHLVGTRDADGNMRVYLDGVLVGTATRPGDASNDRELWIARHLGTYVNTAVAGVGVWDYELTADDVTSLYTFGLTYPGGNLPDDTALQIAPGASFDLDGRHQTVASLADHNGGGGTVLLGGGTLTVAGDDVATTFSGTIDGAGGLVKTGTGSLTLTGPNTYQGTTTVSAGTLLVNGTHANAGAYTVNAGATLGGTGTIGLAAEAAVTFAGGSFFAPGTSPGTLTVDGDLAMETDSTYLWEFGPAGHDLVDMTGSLTLDDWTLALIADGAEPVFGEKYYLFTGFSTLDLDGGSNPANFNALLNFDGAPTWDPAYLSLGRDDAGLYLFAIPEPGTLLLLAAGVLGLLAAPRRRRR